VEIFGKPMESFFSVNFVVGSFLVIFENGWRLGWCSLPEFGAKKIPLLLKRKDGIFFRAGCGL
jgi:hypothetical protein